VADGFAPDWMHTWGRMTGFGFREDTDPIEGAPLDMQLARGDVPIHGRLLDPDGKPLVGARVRLERVQVPPDRDLTKPLEHEKQLGPEAYFLSSGPNFDRRMWPEWAPLIPGLPREVRTDADGRFTMSGLGRDRIAWLDISAPSVRDTTIM